MPYCTVLSQSIWSCHCTAPSAEKYNAKVSLTSVASLPALLLLILGASVRPVALCLCPTPTTPGSLPCSSPNEIVQDIQYVACTHAKTFSALLPMILSVHSPLIRQDAKCTQQPSTTILAWDKRREVCPRLQEIALQGKCLWLKVSICFKHTLYNVLSEHVQRQKYWI